MVAHRRKGRPGVVDGAPAAEAGRPGASSAPKTLISRSLWPAGQDEGAKRSVDLVRSPQLWRPGADHHGSKSTATPSLRREAGGGGKKDNVRLAVPQRKGNDSEGRAAPVDGSGGHHEQSPGRGAGGVGKRVKL